MKQISQTLHRVMLLIALLIAPLTESIALDLPENAINKLLKTNKLHVNAKSSPVFEGRGDGVDTCPVTGDTLVKKELKAEIHGRTVYFCCHGCLRRALQMPDKYVKETLDEQKLAVETFMAKVKLAGIQADPDMCD